MCVYRAVLVCTAHWPETREREIQGGRAHACLCRAYSYIFAGLQLGGCLPPHGELDFLGEEGHPIPAWSKAVK